MGCVNCLAVPLFLFVRGSSAKGDEPPPIRPLPIHLTIPLSLWTCLSLSHWVAHVPALSSWRRGANLGQQFQERRQRTATVKPPCGLLVQVVLMGEQQGEKGTGLTQH